MPVIWRDPQAPGPPPCITNVLLMTIIADRQRRWHANRAVWQPGRGWVGGGSGTHTHAVSNATGLHDLPGGPKSFQDPHHSDFGPREDVTEHHTQLYRASWVIYYAEQRGRAPLRSPSEMLSDLEIGQATPRCPHLAPSALSPAPPQLPRLPTKQGK